MNFVIICKSAPRGKSADELSLLPRAQWDAQREWMKLRFGHICVDRGSDGGRSHDGRLAKGGSMRTRADTMANAQGQIQGQSAQG